MRPEDAHDPAETGQHQVLIRRNDTTGELAYHRCYSTESAGKVPSLRHWTTWPAKKKPEHSADQAVVESRSGKPKSKGLSVTGPNGLLKQFTKNVLDTALNEEITEHLGHGELRAPGDRDSSNVRNPTVATSAPMQWFAL